MTRPLESGACAADSRVVDAALLEPFALTECDARVHANRPFYWVNVAIGSGAACGFSDADAAKEFAARYRDLPCARPARRFYCASHARDSLYWDDRGAAFRWNGALPSTMIAFLADAVVTTLSFGADPHTVTFHAAALATHHGAFALVGSSGSGKTTTAIASALAGYGLYSDEFCRIGEAGVEPFPRSLNLRSGGVDLLARSAFARSTLRAKLRAHIGGGWLNAGYEEILGNSHLPARRPLRHVFLIAGNGTEPAITPTTRYEVLKHIAPYARVVGAGADRVARLLDSLATAQCYNLTLGSPDATVTALSAVVGPARRCA